jgi:hypothetical protein
MVRGYQTGARVMGAISGNIWAIWPCAGNGGPFTAQAPIKRKCYEFRFAEKD